MARQIEDILPNFLDISANEQEQIVRACRYNKYVLKPSHQAHKKKAGKKKTKVVSNKIKNLVKNMSEEEIEKLMANLAENT